MKHVRGLALWLLGMLVTACIMLAIAGLFGMTALEYQNEWMFGMPCAAIALVAMCCAGLYAKMAWKLAVDMVWAVREGRW